MTPDGRFGVPIEPGSARTLVAFVAGSGITPVMAILKTVLRREAGRFFLFYGNRSTADIIFREQLEDLKDATCRACRCSMCCRASSRTWRY